MRSSGERNNQIELTTEGWQKQLNTSQVQMILSCTCERFDLPQVTFIHRPSRNGRYHGWYRNQENTLTVSHLYFGLVIHELAHHLTFWRHGRIGGGSRTYVHHGADYGRALDELYQLWGNELWNVLMEVT